MQWLSLMIVGATAIFAAASVSAAGDKAHGEELYLRYCQGCHGPDGRGGGKAFMPHVGPLAKKGYIDQIDDDSLALVIREGGAAVGKSGYMPSWKDTLPDQSIADIIAYIRTFVAQ
jgi:mono/diheme cytochrome c family protein